MTLGKEKVPLGQELIKRAAEHLQELSDILSDVSFMPHVWCEFDNIGGSRLVERVKFNILEIQENFENFVDKKEYSLDCLDAVKSHEKLVSLGEELGHYNVDTEQVDLCRCLYKQHFQLLLLLESFSKLLRFVKQSVMASATAAGGGGPEVADKSVELAEIRRELLKACRQLDGTIGEAFVNLASFLIIMQRLFLCRIFQLFQGDVLVHQQQRRQQDGRDRHSCRRSRGFRIGARVRRLYCRRPFFRCSGRARGEQACDDRGRGGGRPQPQL